MSIRFSHATFSPLNVALRLRARPLKYPGTGHNSNYAGKISADGNTIAGTLKLDNGPSLPLTFTRATPKTAWAIPLAPAGQTPMAADSHPSFEVATIKLSVPDEDSRKAPFFVQGRYLTANNVSLLRLIQSNYMLQPRQILGAPAWADTTKFDITGVPDTAGQPNWDQEMEMYQKLLADRYKLSFHRGKKEFPVYALKPDKDGPKLTRSRGDPKEPEHAFAKQGAHGEMIVTFANESMTNFVITLMQVVQDKQIVDRTELKGRYDFSLTYTFDPLAPDAGAAPDIFHAVQQQLGLKLEPTKAPVEVFVIDHVERPTAN
jgi:uncharacterized protein (TIGR03435 family)